MKRVVSLLTLFMSFLLYAEAQIDSPVADLLDVRFSLEAGKTKAEDVSVSGFTIQSGSITPTVVYDRDIRQYVATFPQERSQSNYFKVDYKNKDDFKNKLRISFTLEVYVRAMKDKKYESDNVTVSEMYPVGTLYKGAGFGIVQLSDGKTQLRFGNEQNGTYSDLGTVNTLDYVKPEYYHIVYTYDGSNLRGYYNGVNTDNASNVGTLELPSNTSSQWIAIGGDADGSVLQQNREFIGEIASVKMYSSALSGEEVSVLYDRIQKRKSLNNIDILNALITHTLPDYTDSNKARPYLEEGWNLMNSLTTTEEDINKFRLKVEQNLALTVPDAYKYPHFAVISDIHVGRSGWEGRLNKAVETFKNQEHKLDALFIVGDVADNGAESELKKALSTFSVLSPETQVYYMMGNHDWWWGATPRRFRRVMGQRINQFVEIKGYPFIMVSVDGDEGGGTHENIYRSISRNFMKEALERADREYPGKPIFVYAHVPMINTVYGSYAIAPGTVNRAVKTEAMKEICDKYPQVILFSGHSHYPLGDERSIHQGTFTAVHDGNLTFTSIEDGLLDDRSFYLDLAEGCIVTVDEKNDVTIKRVDFRYNEELAKPWVIRAPHDGSMFTYTNKRDGGGVPRFDSNDKLVITDIRSNSFKVTFPQAKDDEGVHHYILELFDKNGKREQRMNIFSYFIQGRDMPGSLSCTVKNLKGIYSDYQVKVTAIDSFYPNNLEHDSNKSEPLVGTVKNMEYENLYLVGSAAPCGWTNSSPEIMTKQGENGKFVWKGLLTKGEFKFLLRKGVWDASVNPVSTQAVTIGDSYNVNITNAISGDYKFTIGKDIYCSVIVDTKDWNVTVVEDKEDVLLYLVGDATPNGWNNTRATPMIKESEGVFTWTGHLKSGHFKFITELGTWNSIVPTSMSNETVLSGVPHAVSNDYRGDYRFVLATAGTYTITVDWNNYTMIVTKKPSENLYLVGDATPNGWYNTRATPMIKESEGVFTWTGNLKAGHLKFITELGTWNSIVPTIKAHEIVIPEFKHYVSDNYQGDYRFDLLDAGNYSIRVNLNESTMFVDKHDSDAPIYIIGDATPTGWYNTRATLLNKIGERMYQWTGKLKSGDFKFITRLGTWYSLVPVPAKNETINVGAIHNITNDYNRGDYRFKISGENEYTVTVDLDKRTLRVDYASNTRSSIAKDDNTHFMVTADNRSVKITTEVFLEKVSLFDISGLPINTLTNKSGTFTIGNNLSSGVYLVELTYQGQRAVYKVLVQ